MSQLEVNEGQCCWVTNILKKIPYGVKSLKACKQINRNANSTESVRVMYTNHCLVKAKQPVVGFTCQSDLPKGGPSQKQAAALWIR